MIIHEFQKNATDKVVIQFKNYKGYDLVDLRIHYLADVPKQEWKATAKGISIRRNLIPELVEGVKKIQQAWEKESKEKK